MNLLSAAERLAALDRSRVTLDVGSCLHTYDQLSSCSACFEICPEAAITAGNPPTLDPKACKSCLACLPTCPSGAYSADDAVVALLTCIARLETSSVELVCKQHPNCRTGISEDHVAVQLRGCLAGLGAGAYLSLAALGVEQISLRLDTCSNCRWGSLRAQIDAQLALAQQILSWWGIDTHFQLFDGSIIAIERPLWNADNPPLSRRDLFRFASMQGKIALARSMTKEKALEGKRPSRDRQRIETTIEHLPARTSRGKSSMLASGFGYLTVSNDCAACQVCARACPTGALELEKEETQYRLKFEAWKCIGCDLCMHVCAPNAIRIDHQPPTDLVFGSQPVVLGSGELVECMRCKTLFKAKTGEKYCPTCEFRRKNPFGSKLPPGSVVSKPTASKRMSNKGV